MAVRDTTEQLRHARVDLQDASHDSGRGARIKNLSAACVVEQHGDRKNGFRAGVSGDLSCRGGWLHRSGSGRIDHYHGAHRGRIVRTIDGPILIEYPAFPPRGEGGLSMKIAGAASATFTLPAADRFPLYSA